jgi:hypothetical protein
LYKLLLEYSKQSATKFGLRLTKEPTVFTKRHTTGAGFIMFKLLFLSNVPDYAKTLFYKTWWVFQTIMGGFKTLSPTFYGHCLGSLRTKLCQPG